MIGFEIRTGNAGGEVYYFVKNGFGDVVSLTDGSGRLAASYVYDTWGNHRVLDAEGRVIGGNMPVAGEELRVGEDVRTGNDVVTGMRINDERDPNHVGVINPFRWRGAYYDESMRLYYIGGRYYDSELGAVINAGQEEAEMTGGHGYGMTNPYEVLGNAFSAETWGYPEIYLPEMLVDGPEEWCWREFWRHAREVLIISAVMLSITAAPLWIVAKPAGIAAGWLGSFKLGKGVVKAGKTAKKAAKNPFVIGGFASVGGLVSGGRAFAQAEPGARNRWGAFAGGFVDGFIGTLGLGIGLAWKKKGIGLLWAVGLGAAGGFAGSAIEQGITTGEFDLLTALGSGAEGAMWNAVGFLGGKWLGSVTMTDPFMTRLVKAMKPSLAGSFLTFFMGGSHI